MESRCTSISIEARYHYRVIAKFLGCRQLNSQFLLSERECCYSQRAYVFDFGVFDAFEFSRVDVKTIAADRRRVRPSGRAALLTAFAGSMGFFCRPGESHTDGR
jgi:hypothetical protein